MISRGTLEGLIRTLVKYDVSFILVGGLAVAVHGYPRATKDVDIVFDTASDNAQRLADALEELGAAVIAADVPEPEQGITAEWLAAGGHFLFATDNGPLDALSASRDQTYADLMTDAVDAELGGANVKACSYEALIDFKEAAGRPQDLADLAGLRAVRDESGSGADAG